MAQAILAHAILAQAILAQVRGIGLGSDLRTKTVFILISRLAGSRSATQWVNVVANAQVGTTIELHGAAFFIIKQRETSERQLLRCLCYALATLGLPRAMRFF